MISSLTQVSLGWPLVSLAKISKSSCTSALNVIAVCGGLTACVALGYYGMRQDVSLIEQNGETLWFSLQGLETLLKTLIDS